MGPGTGFGEGKAAMKAVFANLKLPRSGGEGCEDLDRDSPAKIMLGCHGGVRVGNNIPLGCSRTSPLRPVSLGDPVRRDRHPKRVAGYSFARTRPLKPRMGREGTRPVARICHGMVCARGPAHAGQGCHGWSQPVPFVNKSLTS